MDLNDNEVEDETIFDNAPEEIAEGEYDELFMLPNDEKFRVYNIMSFL